MKRLDYILLAVLFGWIGAHNLIAERTKDGVVQMLLGLLIGGLMAHGIATGFPENGIIFSALPALWLFASVVGDIFRTRKDGRGRPLR